MFLALYAAFTALVAAQAPLVQVQFIMESY
jgi:hypothetical protein